jgi:hypothetical protein
MINHLSGCDFIKCDYMTDITYGHPVRILRSYLRYHSLDVMYYNMLNFIPDRVILRPFQDD